MAASTQDYYQSLYEIATKVNSAGTPNVILNFMVKEVAEAVEAKGCSLMLLSPDRQQLLHTTAYGLSDWYIRKGPVSVDQSLSEALQGTPVAVVDVIEDRRIQYREQARREGIASILSVPMMLRDETIGVIRVYSGERRQFTDEDIFFVGAVANLGAIALENAMFYESVEADYDQFRRQMLEWTAALGSEWMTGDIVAAPEEEELPRSTAF